MEKIIDRIRKLLALASNNPSEAEREAALSKAHQMLIAHNLQMQDVQGTPEEMDVYSLHVPYSSSPWSRTIVNAIAQLYFCKFVFMKHGGNRSYTAQFIGMRSDADVARMVAESILNSVKRQGIIAARTTGGSEASFKSAAATSIYWRCDKLKKEAQQSATATPGTALVVQSLYTQRAKEAEAFAARRFGELKTPKTKLRVKGDEAGRMGRDFGNSVPLTALVKK